jgi:arylsulfatase
MTSLELLPTLCRLAGAETPSLPIDGQDASAVWLGEPGARSPRQTFYYYSGNELHAVRSGRWKLHVPHEYLTVDGPPGEGGKPANWANMKPASMAASGIRGIASRHGYKVVAQEQALYDLQADPGETTDVSRDHPEIVRKLLDLVEVARADLGDALTGRAGRGVRPAGQD